jgi:hypothetical protein
MVGDQPVHKDVENRTVLAYPLADRAVFVGGITAVAVVIGYLLPVLARWALHTSPGLPLRPVFKVVGGVDRPWEIAVNLLIWLLLGLGIARSALRGSVRLAITHTEIQLDKADESRTIARDTVAAAFRNGKNLVVLDHESRPLVDDQHQASPTAIAAAFQAHGYPWLAADPYADLYRRWEPETPELPSEVNAVLAARAIALKKRAGKEAADLRDAAGKLGFVVRDEGSRQFWRPIVRS